MAGFRFVALFILVVTVFAVRDVCAKDQWVKVRSRNFNLIGNAAEKDIRGAAEKLEQFRAVFGTLLPQMKFESQIPTTVIVFKDDNSLTPFKPLNANGKPTDWVAGYFQPGEDVNYIALTTDGAREGAFRTIFHEYLHFLVENTFGGSHVPLWLNEGLAGYYERFQIKDGRTVELGEADPAHLRAIRSGQLIAPDTFFETDHGALRQKETHGAGIFYAQSWAMVHYLLNGDKGRRASQVGEFLSLLKNKMAARDAFRHAFGTDYAGMDAELRKYILRDKFRLSYSTIALQPAAAFAAQTSAIGENEAKATLGDLLVQSERFDEAGVLLKEVIKSDPASLAANTSMGFARIRQGRYEEAGDYLEKAVAAENLNFLVYYRYAFTLSREFHDPANVVPVYSDESARKMRAALKKSIAANPMHADSYGLLGLVSLVRRERFDEGVFNLKKAIALAPDNWVYRLNLASIYINQEYVDEAQPVLEELLKTSPGAEVRDRAEKMLASVGAIRGRMERAKLDGGEGRFGRRVVVAADAVPLTDEEIARINAEIEYDAISRALRVPKSGEARLTGLLSRVECGAGRVIYTVKTGEQTVKLTTRNFDGLMLRAFDRPPDWSIGCQGFRKEFYAILTYIPQIDAKINTNGELIAIEIVPEKFKLP